MILFNMIFNLPTFIGYLFIQPKKYKLKYTISSRHQNEKFQLLSS